MGIIIFVLFFIWISMGLNYVCSITYDHNSYFWKKYGLNDSFTFSCALTYLLFIGCFLGPFNFLRKN